MPNMHKDHVASCLCCTHLDMGFEADYSDVTPGEGEYCRCEKGHFYDCEDRHKLVVLAPECADFEANS